MTLETADSKTAFSPQQQHRIVEENMGLVGSIVKRFAATGYDMEDLFQIGCVGLVKAVQRFDNSFGVKLSTYAVPVILGEIKRHLRDDGAVRISRSVKTNAMHIRAYIDRVSAQQATVPTVSDIAAHLNLTEEDVILAMDAARPISYLQAPDTETGLALMDTVPAPDTQDQLLDHLALRDLIKTLPERDQRLLQLRYFQNKTQTEVATYLGISQVQVSRLEKKLLLHLRANLTP